MMMISYVTRGDTFNLYNFFEICPNEHQSQVFYMDQLFFLLEI